MKDEGEQLVMGMPVAPRWTNKNPAVGRWGFGPEGEKCGTCLYLFLTRSGSGKRFYKCTKRCEVEGISAGPRTDHRVRWDACKKYVPETPPAGAVLERPSSTKPQ